MVELHFIITSVHWPFSARGLVDLGVLETPSLIVVQELRECSQCTVAVGCRWREKLTSLTPYPRRSRCSGGGYMGPLWDTELAQPQGPLSSVEAGPWDVPRLVHIHRLHLVPPSASWQRGDRVPRCV